MEDILFEEGLDLAAKHWTVYASTRGDARLRGAGSVRHLRPLDSATTPAATYGAIYSGVTAPSTADPGEVFNVTLDVRNTGWLEWNSHQSQPVLLSYHWQDRNGRTIVHDGLRSRLPVVIAQGQTARASMRVRAPEPAGEAMLAIDLVHEGVAWFSDEGVPPATIPIRLRAAK